MKILIVLLLVLVVLLVLVLSGEIEVYEMSSFPSNIISFHFPCTENEIFDTNCACHTRCKDNMCSNAVSLCRRYSEEHSCKYVLTRGTDNRKIATLKRSITKEEYKKYSYDSKIYPKDDKEAKKLLAKKLSNQSKHVGSNLKEVMERIGGPAMQQVLNDLNRKDSKNVKYCDIDRKNSSLYNNNVDDFLKKGIALVALNYRAPLTLLNSVRTWNSSGLLSMMEDKVMILSDPYTNEILLSLDHGFRVVQPNQIEGSKKSKPNVFTIGAAFYYSLHLTKSDYILFLENDFAIDTTLTKQEIAKQLLAAAGMLDRGAEIVRLLSRKGQGCGTFKGCHHHGFNLKAVKPIDRTRNWFSFYCPRDDNKEYVSDCLANPRFRCFTSWDSNWSLNAIMVKRKSILEKQYTSNSRNRVTIADVALQAANEQDKFESSMIQTHGWMRWKVPICISYDGLFIHQEIETST